MWVSFRHSSLTYFLVGYFLASNIFGAITHKKLQNYFLFYIFRNDGLHICVLSKLVKHRFFQFFYDFYLLCFHRLHLHTRLLPSVCPHGDLCWPLFYLCYTFSLPALLFSRSRLPVLFCDPLILTRMSVWPQAWDCPLGLGGHTIWNTADGHDCLSAGSISCKQFRRRIRVLWAPAWYMTAWWDLVLCTLVQATTTVLRSCLRQLCNPSPCLLPLIISLPPLPQCLL